jgi:hypothetical protein
VHDEPGFPGLSLAARRVLREDQPTRQELDAAFRRLAQKPRKHAPARLVSHWLIAGLVMGLGVAFGAEAVVKRLDPPSAAVPSEPAPLPRVVSKTKLGRAPLAIPQDTPEPTASAADAPRPPPPSSAYAKAPTGELSEPPPAEGAIWTKAAQGLRDGDFAKTESALDALEHAGTIADREAARLIRAQLMLHQSNPSGARALLEDLANNAQSAQVRAKARSLLVKSSIKSNSALNAAPSGT